MGLQTHNYPHLKTDWEIGLGLWIRGEIILFEGLEEMSLANVRFELDFASREQSVNRWTKEKKETSDQGSSWIESPGVSDCMENPGGSGWAQVCLCVYTHLHMPHVGRNGVRALMRSANIGQGNAFMSWRISDFIPHGLAVDGHPGFWAVEWPDQDFEIWYIFRQCP